jgi:hypothetical protein
MTRTEGDAEGSTRATVGQLHPCCGEQILIDDCMGVYGLGTKNRRRSSGSADASSKRPSTEVDRRQSFGRKAQIPRVRAETIGDRAVSFRHDRSATGPFMLKNFTLRSICTHSPTLDSRNSHDATSISQTSVIYQVRSRSANYKLEENRYSDQCN